MSRKVALVTGGSRGIGAAVAVALAADGYDIALTYERSETHAVRTRERISALGREVVVLRADSASPNSMQAAVGHVVDRFGGLQVLVNNAGIFPYGPTEEIGLDEIDRALFIHARAPFLAARSALPQMSEGGRIISIGSALAERVPSPGLALYSMTKAALVGMTKGLAREVGRRGITVNLVQPGSTDTDMNPADAPHADAERALSALGRYASPNEVAAVVAFLASASASYITGAVVNVDGGFSA